MRSKGELLSCIIACHMFLATSALAQASCDIAPETKQAIEKILCGQTAQEKVYQKFGPDCFKRSVTKRLEDTAIQIFSYQKCSDADFSVELMQANLKALSFMENLSVCISETVDLEQIMEDRLEFVKRKAGTMNCSSSLRHKLRQRRPAFEAMIKQANEFDLSELLASFGVTIDDNGNVVSR